MQEQRKKRVAEGICSFPAHVAMRNKKNCKFKKVGNHSVYFKIIASVNFVPSFRKKNLATLFELAKTKRGLNP